MAQFNFFYTRFLYSLRECHEWSAAFIAAYSSRGPFRSEYCTGGESMTFYKSSVWPDQESNQDYQLPASSFSDAYSTIYHSAPQLNKRFNCFSCRYRLSYTGRSLLHPGLQRQLRASDACRTSARCRRHKERRCSVSEVAGRRRGWSGLRGMWVATSVRFRAKRLLQQVRAEIFHHSRNGLETWGVSEFSCKNVRLPESVSNDKIFIWIRRNS